MLWDELCELWRDHILHDAADEFIFKIIVNIKSKLMSYEIHPGIKEQETSSEVSK